MHGWARLCAVHTLLIVRLDTSLHTRIRELMLSIVHLQDHCGESCYMMDIERLPAHGLAVPLSTHVVNLYSEEV